MDPRRLLRETTVAGAGIRDLVSITGDATIREAIGLMKAEKVGCVVVVDSERVQGVFTERDLVVSVLGKGVPLDTLIGECMTPDPVEAGIDEPLHLVLAKMRQGGFRHLPVVDADGRPKGTIGVRRAVHILGDCLPQAVYNLPPEPHQFPGSREGG